MVRFHSLFGSKRYADTPDEQAEVLSRHNIALSDLFGPVDVEDASPVALTISTVRRNRLAKTYEAWLSP